MSDVTRRPSHPRCRLAGLAAGTAPTVGPREAGGRRDGRARAVRPMRCSRGSGSSGRRPGAVGGSTWPEAVMRTLRDEVGQLAAGRGPAHRPGDRRVGVADAVRRARPPGPGRVGGVQPGVRPAGERGVPRPSPGARAGRDGPAHAGGPAVGPSGALVGVRPEPGRAGRIFTVIAAAERWRPLADVHRSPPGNVHRPADRGGRPGAAAKAARRVDRRSATPPAPPLSICRSGH